MSIMSRIRLYHASLAILAILAYITGELGIIHAWLGYGVAVVILLRLLWALSGERQVGLMRFYPSFEGLNTSNIFTHPAISKSLMLGIAICLITVTLTGITMDKGQSIGLNSAAVASTAQADESENGMSEEGENEEGFITEAHELFANLLLLFIGMHVAYLFVFKRPLAKFMLFVPKSEKKS